MPSKKQTPLQALQAEFRHLTKLQADDERIIKRATVKLAKDARREIARLNAAAKKASAQAAATQLRYDRAASKLATAHGRSTKALRQRIAILEARIKSL